jgi:hypothetical protein
MSVLRNWFGPSRKEIWRQLSEKMGAVYSEGGFSKSDRVDVSHGEWTITLDCYYNAATKTTYTRLSVPYTNPDAFHFTIYRPSVFTELGKRLGMQDIEVEHAEFDQDFVIKGNDESEVRALFANRELREQLSAQKDVHLSIESGSSWFNRSLPPRTDRLVFQVPGVIKDMERLEKLFALMAVTIDQLCDIGSAYALRPPE